MKLVSACLLGVNCKYDGGNNRNEKIISLLRDEILIPVCPEQLGGLPTPRVPSEIKGDRVYSVEGKDLTENFIKGAKETLRIAKLYGVKEAIFKDGSPSCGVNYVYDGTFKGKKIKGKGITARLLEKEGIKVISEKDI
ncbi:MAG: DUF523 domain-containing protein [Caldiserica bacterium]|nr:MAG: DUF523 domain-containing protein [Caldisericota bacterium]